MHLVFDEQLRDIELPSRRSEEREAAECVPVERGGLMIFGVPCEGAVVFGIFENIYTASRKLFLVSGVRWHLTW